MLTRYLRTIRLALSKWRHGHRSNADIFTEVYEKHRWGRGTGDYFSGPGSYPEFAEPYCELIRSFIDDRFAGRARIVDLGCGDFRIGRCLVGYLPECHYLGIDVVPSMIADNQARHAGERVRFECLDIVEDELPSGDVALLRQVLQHLSNAQVAKVLHKLERYPVTFITEHYPKDVVVANVDKVPGHRSRRRHRSAVCLDKPPFNVTGIELVLVTPYHYPGEELRVFKLEN